MLAIELNEDAPNLVNDALEASILINVAQGNVIRLLPPLTLTDEEADSIVESVSNLISD